MIQFVLGECASAPSMLERFALVNSGDVAAQPIRCHGISHPNRYPILNRHLSAILLFNIQSMVADCRSTAAVATNGVRSEQDSASYCEL
jgi:hypothetical protein